MIILPNHLNSGVYLRGLRQPLEQIAEVLDQQGKPAFARALRDAATVCDIFSKVLIEKKDTIYLP